MDGVSIVRGVLSSIHRLRCIIFPPDRCPLMVPLPAAKQVEAHAHQINSAPGCAILVRGSSHHFEI